MLTRLRDHARTLGCVEAWVLSERSNQAAMALYEATGGTEAQDDVVLFSWPLEGE